MECFSIVEPKPFSFSFLLNATLHNFVFFGNFLAGNFVGPVNSYTGLPYGTSNYHWWLNSPYKTAGIPTGVDKDYRQTIACGAGPMRTYSFDTHRVVGGITASRNSWPGIVSFIPITIPSPEISNDLYYPGGAETKRKCLLWRISDCSD